jgi:Glycine cleavage system T protein (aminomethyltransferase)
VTPKYEYSFKRQNWFAHSAAEVKATREKVALFDQSTFAKIPWSGVPMRSASCSAYAPPMSRGTGRAVYTQWLNPRGGIEAI